jgi:hypothetical protein
MVSKSFALRAAALLTLAACGGLPVSNAEYSPGYAPGEVRAPNNMVPTVVIGNPFSISQPDFAADVVDAMQGHAVGPVSFAVSNDTSAVYRVIMVFTPSGGVTGQALCNRPPQAQAVAGAGASATTPLVAALCRGDSFLAYAHGNVNGSGGPTSQAFRDGVGQFTRLLFPAGNPERCVNC